MLTDTISSCVQTIQRKQEVQMKKQSDDYLEEALKRLSVVSAGVQDTLACMKAMQEKSIVSGPILKEESRDELLESANICGKTSAEYTLSLEAVKLFETRAKAARAELVSAWQQRASEYSDGAKGYLSLIAGLTDDPKATRTLVASIETLVNSAPTRKNIGALSDCVTEAKNKAASFPLQPEIEAFLRKVSAQRATVLDLTPEVVAWLQARNLKGKLRISF